VAEYVIDGLATFVARVRADSHEDAAELVRSMQGVEPALAVGQYVEISELSWGVALGVELMFPYGGDRDDPPPVATDRIVRYSAEDAAMLAGLAESADKAAEGDSNDREIGRLRAALNVALGMLSIPRVS